MKRVKEKIIASFIVASLISPTHIMAEPISTELEQVIRTIKSKIEIPENLKQFSYSSSNDDYSMTWNSLDDKASLNITCGKEGELYQYYYYNSDSVSSPTKTIAKIDPMEAQEIAEDFLNKVVPEYAGDLEKTPRISGDSWYDYNLEYELLQNDIPVLDHKVTISVNKITGDVSSFNGFRYDKAATYGESTPKVEKGKAQELYLKEIGLPLNYQVYYTSRESSMKSFLAYCIQNNGEEAINAISGNKVKKYITQPNSYITGGAGGAKEESATSDAAGIKLTPAEQQTVDRAKEGLTPAALKTKISQYFPVLKTMEIKDSNTYQSQNSYQMSVHCQMPETSQEQSEAYFNCDGKTGELKWYNYMVRDREKKENVAEWTKEDALALITKISPSKVNNVIATAESKAGRAEEVFQFTRIHNDIPVSGQGITVSYDSTLGQVTQYVLDWDSQINFPGTQGILTQEEVMNKIGINLYYMQTAPHHFDLVYTIKDSYGLFDALTGHKVDYAGKEIKDTTKEVYTDIKGHPEESIITTLYNSGIYLEGTQLKPDTAITQAEMVRLLCQSMFWFDTTERAYKQVIEAGVLTDEEKDPNKKLTRAEGIRYLMNAGGYKKVAQLPHIYDYPYPNETVEASLKGYVTLAYGLGILGEGKEFGPDKELTKAEALRMIYGLLVSRQ